MHKCGGMSVSGLGRWDRKERQAFLSQSSVFLLENSAFPCDSGSQLPRGRRLVRATRRLGNNRDRSSQRGWWPSRALVSPHLGGGRLDAHARDGDVLSVALLVDRKAKPSRVHVLRVHENHRDRPGVLRAGWISAFATGVCCSTRLKTSGLSGLRKATCAARAVVTKPVSTPSTRLTTLPKKFKSVLACQLAQNTRLVC